jgi:hypothetical protein
MQATGLCRLTRMGEVGVRQARARRARCLGSLGRRAESGGMPEFGWEWRPRAVDSGAPPLPFQVLRRDPDRALLGQ